MVRGAPPCGSVSWKWGRGACGDVRTPVVPVCSPWSCYLAERMHLPGAACPVDFQVVSPLPLPSHRQLCYWSKNGSRRLPRWAAQSLGPHKTWAKLVFALLWVLEVRPQKWKERERKVMKILFIYVYITFKNDVSKVNFHKLNTPIQPAPPKPSWLSSSHPLPLRVTITLTFSTQGR